MEAATQPAPVLRLLSIRKEYPSVLAVDDVSLDLHPGEIHALVGENGAGKSTLATIAAGEVRADTGSVLAHGTVGLVHQHFELVGRLRVWQNIVLGREPRAGWRVDASAARARTRDLAEGNALEIDPNAFVDELPVGMQQRVELLRELNRNPAVLLLDEPTAALAPAEIDGLFSTLRRLATAGVAILIVTHKLGEVISFAHGVSVMRHGRIVERTLTRETSIDEIARAMVAGALPSVAARTDTTHAPCLRVEQLCAGSGSAYVRNLDLTVQSGEIVGIAGVEGNGQNGLADAIAGVVAYTGRITLTGRGGNAPRAAYIAQDRNREALVLNWSIVDNAILGRQHLAGVHRGWWLNRVRARADAQAIVKRFDVRAASLDAPVKTLSGGNQQKIVVGRALLDEPDFVLAYNPTRGIDVGAGAVVASHLMQARNQGAAILLISFDLDEILNLADRIVVMYHGSIIGSVHRADANPATLGRMMAGGR